MVPVVSDHTWYFPCLLHLERGWIAFLDPLNKVMEGVGALHGVGCEFLPGAGKKREKGVLSFLLHAVQAWRQGTLGVLST